MLLHVGNKNEGTDKRLRMLRLITVRFFGFTGVFIFHMFAPKHRLWVLVKTLQGGGSNMYQQSMFLVKIASYCMGNMINIGLHNDSILLND